jgi:hypothetical protein
LPKHRGVAGDVGVKVKATAPGCRPVALVKRKDLSALCQIQHLHPPAARRGLGDIAFRDGDRPVLAGIGDNDDLDPSGGVVLGDQRGKAAIKPGLFVMCRNNHTQVKDRHASLSPAFHHTFDAR